MKNTVYVFITLIFLVFISNKSNAFITTSLFDNTVNHCTTPPTPLNVHLHASVQGNGCEGAFVIKTYSRLAGASAWNLVTSYITPFPTITNSFYNEVAVLSQPANTSYEYMIKSYFNPQGPLNSFCDIAESDSGFSSIITITSISTPTASFKINNQAVNTSTAVKICDGNPINMTNVTASGANSSYTYRLGFAKDGGPIIWDAWINITNGYPPATIDIKTRMFTIYGSNISGAYNIYLEVNNNCSSVYQYWGKLEVLSSNLNVTLQACNTFTCSVYTNISTTTTCAAPHTAMCKFNSYIKVVETTPSYLSGQWACKLESAPVGLCSSPLSLVFDKPMSNLNDISELNVINLNYFAYTYGGTSSGYIIDNSATKVWKFTLSLTNDCQRVVKRYSCWLRNINTGCRSENPDITGVGELDNLENLENGWNIYPNPATDEVTILFDQLDDNKVQFNLYDINGQLVKYQIKNQNDGQTTIDISSLSKGVYIIEKSGVNTTTKKLIVE